MSFGRQDLTQSAETHPSPGATGEDTLCPYARYDDRHDHRNHITTSPGGEPEIELACLRQGRVPKQETS